MNIYFLVEGKRTETKVYPKWLNVLLPSFNRVMFPDEARNNNYFLISGNGYPSILEHLKDAVKNIENNGNFDYLVLSIDADEQTISERKTEINEFIERNNIQINGFELKILVQNKTFETWLLGNAKIFPRQPNEPEFVEMVKFYNTSLSDPELMEKYADYDRYAHFHHDYLKLMLAERNIRYTKKNPREVGEPHYINSLIDRISTTKHLQSFNELIEFCDNIERSL